MTVSLNVPCVAGAQSDSEVNSVVTGTSDTDRGYTSDGELYEAQSGSSRHSIGGRSDDGTTVNNTGSWLLVSARVVL